MQHQLEPSNSLEQSFQQALSDNAHVQEFYRKLIQSKLFLLSDSNDDDDIKGTKPEDGTMSMNVMQWYVPLEDGGAQPFAPVFTSQTAVDQAIQLMQSEGTAYHGVMELQAATVFNMLLQSGVDMILNPNTSLSKMIEEDEIRYMLLPDLALVEHKGNLSILENLLQTELPLVASLKDVLSQYINVKHGYLIEVCQLDFKRSRSEYTFTLGVQFANNDNLVDFNSICSDIRALHGEIELHDRQLNAHLVQIDTKDPISQYCLEKTKPFYTTSLLTRIKHWLK